MWIYKLSDKFLGVDSLFRFDASQSNLTGKISDKYVSMHKWYMIIEKCQPNKNATFSKITVSSRIDTYMLWNRYTLV